MEINQNWNFKELVGVLKSLKEQYWEKVRSFSYFDLHEKVVYMRKFRDDIYKLDFEEWKKDKAWEYINNYEFLYVLKRLK
jgi:hypothetical protein